MCPVSVGCDALWKTVGGKWLILERTTASRVFYSSMSTDCYYCHAPLKLRPPLQQGFIYSCALPN